MAFGASAARAPSARSRPRRPRPPARTRRGESPVSSRPGGRRTRLRRWRPNWGKKWRDGHSKRLLWPRSLI